MVPHPIPVPGLHPRPQPAASHDRETHLRRMLPCRPTATAVFFGKGVQAGKSCQRRMRRLVPYGIHLSCVSGFRKRHCIRIAGAQFGSSASRSRGHCLCHLDSSGD